MGELMVPVIYGSVRTQRQGIKAARYVVRELRLRDVDAILIDPLEYRFPLLDLMYKEFPRGTAPEPMEKLADIFRRADGFAIVSGEYNNGIPPALKNMLDHYLEEYFWRPAGIVCYSDGRFGGVRAAMQLRMTLAELGMVTMPTLLPVPNVPNAFDDDGEPADARMRERTARFFDEFLWYARALKTSRDAYGVPS